jgi:hypothetical protein
MAIDEHRLADNVGGGAKSRFPIAIAEDEYRIRVFRSIVLRREQASQRGLETKKLKVVAADDFGIFVFGYVVP